MNTQEFRAEVKELEEYYGEQLSEAQLKIWQNTFGLMSRDYFHKVWMMHIQESTRKSLPTIGELNKIRSNTVETEEHKKKSGYTREYWKADNDCVSHKEWKAFFECLSLMGLAHNCGLVEYEVLNRHFLSGYDNALVEDKCRQGYLLAFLEEYRTKLKNRLYKKNVDVENLTSGKLPF